MKLINVLTKSGNEDKLILAASLGVMLTGALPEIKTHSDELPAVYEVDENGNPIPAEQTGSSKNDYINTFKQIMSADNYAPIKTLYKIQGVLDDMAAIKTIDYSAQNESNANITEVLSSIKPYLSESRRGVVNGLADNINRTRQTFKQIQNIKSKISELPSDMPKNERFKTILTEIPNISGIPILENINNIKQILSLLSSAPKSLSENEDKSSEDALNYNDVYELVDMFSGKS